MEKAVRYSKKREAILEAIRSTKTHPSADWVYQTLKPTHPDLSLGTVYRNLDFFRQHGTIISVGVVKGQERFDATTTPHTHTPLLFLSLRNIEPNIKQSCCHQ